MPQKHPTPALPIPDILATALAADNVASERFENLPPSHQREHVKYIMDAKKTETQAKRVEQTIARLRQKPRK